MRIRKATVAFATAAVALVAAGGLWVDRSANAADHLDPPGRTTGDGINKTDAADIADVYAFNTADRVTIAVTGAGPAVAGVGPTYDRNVITLIHISNDGRPDTDEFVIDIRYGLPPGSTTQFGVQFTGIPGSTAPLVGPVQTTLAQGPIIKATAGLFDDPFFFDLQGFNDTKATGTLMFNNKRNFFAGKNITGMVVDFPRAAVANGTNPLTIWAETRRIGA